ncbi:(d)CMP kinase [Akkermansiaceae bacterium]|nr:(d)CMP kinase [Akkermansiaceae bacterium]MDB4262400.1 (d)CMP kinase [bacterium]MDB0068399.1 (d)CMP kinase [Akkermansiaceae bacterium]MDB4142334.1 (d)CMP kinase [Akkermansiaceae bacterium]MDB4406873.1 (d)CMP kinase [Akkermansiaceae bacterium]
MSSSHRAVAIDGPAASGKSTVAKRLADSLGMVMVNSGAMYRAVTWQVLKNGASPQDVDAVIKSLNEMEITCGMEEGRSTIAINGQLLDEELRSEAVNNAVSHVAAVPQVRDRLVQLQRDYLATSDVVMEGRDIGSVVFKDTPYKLYIDASEEVRRARRAADGEADAVAARDAQDSQRKTAPLKISDGAIVIDSSELQIDEVVEAARQALLKLGWQDPS